MKTLVLLCCLSIGLGSQLVGGGPASGAPTQWSTTKSPKDNGEVSLLGVSCVQSDWCMAAGRVHGGRTLFESWSGSAWTFVPSPKPPGQPTYLQGVLMYQLPVLRRRRLRLRSQRDAGGDRDLERDRVVGHTQPQGRFGLPLRGLVRGPDVLRGSGSFRGRHPRNRTPLSSNRGTGARGRSTRAHLKQTATTWRECPARVRRTVLPLVRPAPTQEVPRASS